MSVPYELIVKEDLHRGHGTVSVTMPGGGSATGNKIGLHSFADNVYSLGDFATLADALTAIGSDAATLVVSESMSVVANATVPSTLALAFVGAGAFDIANGITVTIQGGLEAGRRRIFTGTGTANLAAARVDWVFPEWWGAVALKATSGAPADSTAAINAALATKKHVSFDSGRYGTTGGHVQIGEGQRVEGKGITYPAGGLGGTELVKLSGTAVLWTAGYAIGMYLGDLRFNGGGFAGNCLLWSAHYSETGPLQFSDQGGTDYALFLKDSNLCTFGPLHFWSNIYAAIGDEPATGSYGILYSRFTYIGVGPTTTYALNLTASRLSVFDYIYTESPIRLYASANNLQFRYVATETGRDDMAFIAASGVSHVSFDKVRLYRTAVTTYPEVAFIDTYRCAITDLFLDDAVSAATRAVVQLTRDAYTSLRNLGCNTTNAHRLVEVVTGQVSHLQADGLYSYTGAAATCVWWVTHADVRNSNLGHTFSAASDHVSFDNIDGTLGLTNGTQVSIGETCTGLGSTINFADGDTTPSVAFAASPSAYYAAINTGPTTITTFDGGFVGQRISVVFTTANTTFDFSSNATMKGNAGVDWTAAVGDRLDAELIGTVWYCEIVKGS